MLPLATHHAPAAASHLTHTARDLVHHWRLPADTRHPQTVCQLHEQPLLPRRSKWSIHPPSTLTSTLRQPNLALPFSLPRAFCDYIPLHFLPTTHMPTDKSPDPTDQATESSDRRERPDSLYLQFLLLLQQKNQTCRFRSGLTSQHNVLIYVKQEPHAACNVQLFFMSTFGPPGFLK